MVFLKIKYKETPNGHNSEIIYIDNTRVMPMDKEKF